MTAATRWRRRPVLAWALRLAAFVIPVTLSFGVAMLAAAALPRITDGARLLLWVVVIGGCAFGTLVVLERVARRALPLAALLDMSLAFPDDAPRRFAIARTRGQPSELRARLVAAHRRGDVDEATRLRGVLELVLALSVHDRATRGHSERVRVFTEMLAEEVGIGEEDRDRLRWAAVLHDIGKLEVPVSTLHKSGEPSDAEWDAIHRHPEEGAHLVGPLMPWLGQWGEAVVQHHERWDGTGYPHRLHGEEISLAARIVALADSYEVMTAPRSYKRPMSVSAARRELTRVAGSQLDPTLVRAFLNISVGRLWRIVGFGAWIGQLPLLSRFATSVTSWASPSLVAAGAAIVIAFGGGAGVPPAGSVLAATVTAPATTTPPDSAAGTPSDATPGLTWRSGAATVSGPSAATTGPAQSPAASSAAPPSVSHSGAAPASLTGSSAASTGTCTTHCTGNNNSACTSWCMGEHNTGCLTECIGNHDTACRSFCTGNYDIVCTVSCIGNVPALPARPLAG